MDITCMDITWHIMGNYKVGWKIVAENRYLRVEVSSHSLLEGMERAEKELLLATKDVIGGDSQGKGEDRICNTLEKQL